MSTAKTGQKRRDRGGKDKRKETEAGEEGGREDE